MRTFRIAARALKTNILTFCRETKTCLDLLRIMGKKWAAAMHCHDVLSILVADLRVQHGKGYTSTNERDNNEGLKSSHGHCRTLRVPTHAKSSKRQKLSSSDLAGEEWVESNQQAPLNQQHGVDGYNVVSGENFSPAVEQGNEFQWLQDPALQGIAPDKQDIFGHLSWESLFQGDGADTYLWPYNSNGGQDVSRTVLGQAMERLEDNYVEEHQKRAEDANSSALRAMATRDDPPPPGVLREGPAPPYVEVRFAEEWE
jgi:hypothetical protein